MAREGPRSPITFNIVRDEIPRSSVPDAFWLKPGIAYVDIEQFNENTSKEMEDKLKKLGEKNIKGLVLDLREQSRRPAERRRRRRRPLPAEGRRGRQPSRPRVSREDLHRRATAITATIIRSWCW